MDEPKIKNAKEAKELTSINRKPVEWFMQQIAWIANNGGNVYIAHEYFTDEITLSLIEKGFKVEKKTDPFNKEVLVVSW
jgi:hypothetical protein